MPAVHARWNVSQNHWTCIQTGTVRKKDAGQLCNTKTGWKHFSLARWMCRTIQLHEDEEATCTRAQLPALYSTHSVLSITQSVILWNKIKICWNKFWESNIIWRPKKLINIQMLKSLWEWVFLFLLVCFLPLLNLTLDLVSNLLTSGNKPLLPVTCLQMNNTVSQLEIRTWQIWRRVWHPTHGDHCF